MLCVQKKNYSKPQAIVLEKQPNRLCVCVFCSLRESMGIAADGSNKAFPSADVDAFLERKRAQISVDIVEELSRFNTRHFVLAVDPSGGGGSAFAVSSMVQVPTGQVIVRCSPAAGDSFPAALPPTILTRQLPAPQTNLASDMNYGSSAGG